MSYRVNIRRAFQYAKPCPDCMAFVKPLGLGKHRGSKKCKASADKLKENILKRGVMTPNEMEFAKRHMKNEEK